MESKRIYSYNLCAFIYMTTGVLPSIRVDEKCEHLYYFVFPESEAIAAAINAYHENEAIVLLHKYLNAYTEIKKLVQGVRNNGANC